MPNDSLNPTNDESKRTISDEQWSMTSKALDVEIAALHAVAEIESAGDGFLPSGVPKVLFEGHAFHRLTQGRFDDDYPTLSYPKWTKKFYAATPAGEWQRLERACALDRAAALQSASWGAFQIMGFNYALCGYSDVESFVAHQKLGAAQQLDAFVQFISRPVFLTALRGQHWDKFAAAYNGPGYAVNQYDTKLAKAYAKWSALVKQAADTALAGVGRKKKAAVVSPPSRHAKALPKLGPGRPDFAPVPAKRQRARRRPVKADKVDLRDWLYHPNITKAPPLLLMPHNPRPVANQGDTMACTGFALATTIEYLLDRAQRPVERISGYMLYDMARRYDEWSDNDRKDEGSSLRGALKGWSRHGASALKTWKAMSMPDASNDLDDWFLDGMRRPLGAYYRLKLDVESDLHCALMDVGVLYASALTHAGWDALDNHEAHDAPISPDEIPVIECRKGDDDGGHAFAIVGYTEKGFIVHNSWARTWGRGGFAVLTYSDWRQNAMDCWVAQLGVVTREHESVAQATSLRLEGVDERQVKRIKDSPPVVLSSDDELANHEVSPFVIDMENEGRLSTRGRFRTNDADLTFLLTHHLKTACTRWGITAKGTVDIGLYAHGGLVGEEAAAETARQWVPLLYENRIFPVFLMWETDGLSTVFGIVEDAIKGDDQRIAGDWRERFREAVLDWKDRRIEGLTRMPGGTLWRQMKENADALSSTKPSGVVKLFQEFKRVDETDGLPNVRLHLIGHSAGGIVQSLLGPRAIARKMDIATVNLLAPAVRVDEFDSQLGALIRSQDIRVLVATLLDSAERADPTCKPYGHSLLYLVSRAFEGDGEVPLLGMEKHLIPAIGAHAWGSRVRYLKAPGGSYHPDDPLTQATSHGSMDDDLAVQNAVIRHIKSGRGADYHGQITRDQRLFRES